MTIPAWLLLHVCIGLAGTWLARRYALRRNLVDQPGERRSHAVPTPRGGGIAIVAALLVACAWIGLLPGPAPAWLAWFALGLVLVAGVGSWDDHRPLSPWLRLGVHAAAAACLACAAWIIAGSPTMTVAAFVLAMVLTNVWNFMDGIDGLAASQAILVAVALAALATGAASWLALALLASASGFLPFNVPRARVFLGDVGSGALGFTLAALAIPVFSAPVGSAWLVTLPLSAFLIDAGLTLIGRIRRREPWWHAHVLHAYQRWVRRCGSHMPVTLGYAAWTLASLACLLALLRLDSGTMAVLAVCSAWYAVGTGVWWMLQRKGDEMAMEIRE
jgi:UDP-N-acetylmuramyl pentapeptide phosphotransferase/UDP-N-acetylglucosamine-1-phosphate transferase